MLEERFGVFDTDVHIEPAPIPEGWNLNNVYKRCSYASNWLTKEINWKNSWLMILSIFAKTEIRWIKEAYKVWKELNSAIKGYSNHFHQSRDKLICYELDGIVHTSIWRRHETGPKYLSSRKLKRQTMTLSNGWGLFNYSTLSKDRLWRFGRFAFRSLFCLFSCPTILFDTPFSFMVFHDLIRPFQEVLHLVEW